MAIPYKIWYYKSVYHDKIEISSQIELLEESELPVLISILLGFVYGLARFIPVSASGHVSIFQNLFKLEFNEADHLLFSVLIHIATLVSTIIYYRKDIREILCDARDYITKRGSEGLNESGQMKPGLRMFTMILVASVPLVIALVFNNMMTRLYTSLTFIAIAIFLNGFLLYASDRLPVGKKTHRSATMLDAFLVGLAQVVAIIPGISRTGITVSVALCRGFRRKTAARFSFLIAIPALIGSTIITVFKAFKTGVVWSNFPVYLLGMIVAGVIGFFAIGIARNLIVKGKLTKLAYYCFIVGFIVLILSFIF